MSSPSHLVAVCGGLVFVSRPPAVTVYLRSCGRAVDSIRLPALRVPLPLPVHAVLPQPRRFLHHRTISPTAVDAAGGKDEKKGFSFPKENWREREDRSGSPPARLGAIPEHPQQTQESDR